MNSVETIMSRPVVTVEMDDSLATIKEIFDNARFRHLLVTEVRRLRGVISDRDVLRALSPFVGTPAETRRDTFLLQKRAHQIMTRNLVTLPPTASILDAIVIFNNHRISCIPVIAEDRVPIGIVSWRDILREIMLEHLPNPDDKSHQESQ